MYRVIALDPGGTTGWAMFSAERIHNPLEDVYEFVDERWDCGQIEEDKHHAALYNMLGMFQTDSYIVVDERFEYRNKSRAGLELISREYIGVTELFCQERNVRHVLQSASQAKGFVRDIHIKKLGLWYSNNKHAMDATRHLLFFLTTNTTVDEELRMSLLRKAWK